MQKVLNKNLVLDYKSNSQKVRVIPKVWEGQSKLKSVKTANKEKEDIESYILKSEIEQKDESGD